MEDLRGKIASLKKRIATESERGRKLRLILEKKIAEIFGNKKIPMSYIRDFYLRDKRLVIIALNKSIANELFLKRQQILEGLQGEKILIKELVIK